jgi:hypothetical protein
MQGVRAHSQDGARLEQGVQGLVWQRLHQDARQPCPCLRLPAGCATGW